MWWKTNLSMQQTQWIKAIKCLYKMYLCTLPKMLMIFVKNNKSKCFSVQLDISILWYYKMIVIIFLNF